MATKKTTTKKATTVDKLGGEAQAEMDLAGEVGLIKTLNRAEFTLLLADALTWRDERVDDNHVAEILEAVKAGETPPVVVARFIEDGKTVDIMVDGVHRTTAAIKSKQKTIEGKLISVADRAAAQAQAFALNNHRVLNLTADERRKALLALLQLPAYKKQSNRALAALWKVSDMTIKRYRDMLKQSSPKASQSGHKNKPAATPRAKSPKATSKGSKSAETAPRAHAETSAGLPITIQCAAQLCGGGESLAAAIVTKLTEGQNEGSPEYRSGVQVIEATIRRLQSFVDSYHASEDEEDAKDAAIDKAIADAKAKAAAKTKTKKTAAKK